MPYSGLWIGVGLCYCVGVWTLCRALLLPYLFCDLNSLKFVLYWLLRDAKTGTPPLPSTSTLSLYFNINNVNNRNLCQGVGVSRSTKVSKTFWHDCHLKSYLPLPSVFPSSPKVLSTFLHLSSGERWCETLVYKGPYFLSWLVYFPFYLSPSVGQVQGLRRLLKTHDSRSVTIEQRDASRKPCSPTRYNYSPLQSLTPTDPLRYV